MVDGSEMEAAIDAISASWPKLVVDRQEVVIRFRDPGEIAIDREMKQVIDLMLPSNACYEAILKKFHCIDPVTGNRIPILEAACASKFAALVSPYRQWEKKQQDAVDLRSILLPSVNLIDQACLRELGDCVYPGGGAELLEFLELAIQQKPFPI